VFVWARQRSARSRWTTAVTAEISPMLLSKWVQQFLALYKEAVLITSPSQAIHAL
jgi:hypothetical protein